MTNIKPYDTREDNYLFDLIRAKSKPVMSVKDCSLLSGLSVSTIRRAIADGSLKAFQLTNRSKLIIERKNFYDWMGIESKSYLGGKI